MSARDGPPVHRNWDATLLDGTRIVLRRLTFRDADAVINLYTTLSDDECYFRFFTVHPAHLTDCALSIVEQSENRYALGAFDEAALLGVANYIRCEDADDAEIAIVVAHNQHRRGVGTALLRQLGQIAEDSGVRHLIADVLAENHLMLKMMSESGLSCTRHLDGPVMHVVIDLRKLGG
ncbi:N-acetyltransferase family protein [Mycolicibacterium sp. XJ879]